MKTRVLFAFILILIISSIAYLFFQNIEDKEYIKQLSIEKAKFKFKERDKLLSSFVNRYDKTIFGINDNKSFIEYVKKGKNKSSLDELFLSIIKSSPDMFQLRFLDETGMERIRVDQFRGRYKIISKNELQDKKHRYYFKDIFNEEDKSIWYSMIDLNIEHGKIVRPIQPTLRIGTPVVVDGVKKGILIANIDVKAFFKELKSASIFNIYLVDKEGDFILHPNDSFSWGKYLKGEQKLFDQFKELSMESLLKEEIENERFYLKKSTFKNLDNISIIIEPKISMLAEKINEKNTNRLYYVMILMVTLFLMIYVILKRKELSTYQNHNEELLNEKEKVKSILDSQQSIVIVTDGKEIKVCNKRFLRFFNVNNLEEFKKDHRCICELFEKDDKHEYIQEKMAEEIWVTYILKRKDKVHKVKMSDRFDNKHFFIVSAKIYYKSENTEKYVLTFSDVTELEYLNNNLENIVKEKTKELIELNNSLEQRVLLEVEKNREKDKQIFNKEKMASMGEMIGDIAHHWRQPLSVISTASSGIIMQHDYKILTDKYLIDTMNIITNSAQNLSKTIDNFRDLVQGDMEESLFRVSGQIEKALSISDSTIKDYYIKVEKDIDESIEIFNRANGLLQVLVNILNNSMDVLSKNEDLDKDRYIFISCYKKVEDVVIIVKDNGGGIEPSMLSKIFQPYTTSKHKAQDAGLGLHMVYNIITNQMGGTVEVDNEELEYENKTYTGAVFTINIPYK